MSATRNLSTLLSKFAESSIHSRKDRRRLFTGAISGAILTILLLVMAGMASAQAPMAYEATGSDLFGTINLTTGAFSEAGNMGQLLSGLGVGPGGPVVRGRFRRNHAVPSESVEWKPHDRGNLWLGVYPLRFHHQRRLRVRPES